MKSAPPLPRLFVSIAEAAEMLGVSRAYAYRLAEGDEPTIPTVQFGRRRLVPVAALEQLAADVTRAAS